MGNINYNTLGDLQMDLLRLVRMSAWIALYWTKEVSDVQIYCTRKCTNRLQYNGFASARSNPQGVAFLKAK
jgi:hypothetical protein